MKNNPASVYSCTGSPSGRSYPVYFHFLYEETRSDSDQALLENLAHLDDSAETISLKDTNLLELEQANSQFKNLMRQIKN